MRAHELLDVPLPFFEEGSLHRVQLVAGERHRAGGGLNSGIRWQRQRMGAAEAPDTASLVSGLRPCRAVYASRAADAQAARTRREEAGLPLRDSKSVNLVSGHLTAG